MNRKNQTGGDGAHRTLLPTADKNSADTNNYKKKIDFNTDRSKPQKVISSNSVLSVGSIGSAGSGVDETGSNKLYLNEEIHYN